MNNKHLAPIKTGIWLYFFLLIFEGALRRWFLPGLATPLLVIRDPVAFYIIYLSIRKGVFPNYKWIPIMVCIGVLSIFTALFFGHGNILVALFGARILLIQFPLLFVIGSVFNSSDVIKIGKTILALSIPMAILITIQFYSPQSAWVNKGVGFSLEGAGFSGSGDYFRPPGTFSFITGVSSFFGLVACFVFYFWLNSESINKFLLVGSTAALIISIPTSISRTLFFEVFISFMFFLAAKSTKPGFSKNIVQLVGGLGIVVLLLSNVKILNTQMEAFTDRFTNANETEGGLNGVVFDRFLGGLVSAFDHIDNKHAIFGLGIGMGTNVGAQLISGKTDYLISEAEWGRIMGESGIVFGLIIIFVRIALTFELATKAYALFVRGNYLPWMLMSLAFLLLLQGQWSQPNGLGFYVFIGGLLMGSLNSPPVNFEKR